MKSGGGRVAKQTMCHIHHLDDTPRSSESHLQQRSATSSQAARCSRTASAQTASRETCRTSRGSFHAKASVGGSTYDSLHVSRVYSDPTKWDNQGKLKQAYACAKWHRRLFCWQRPPAEHVDKLQEQFLQGGFSSGLAVNNSTSQPASATHPKPSSHTDHNNKGVTFSTTASVLQDPLRQPPLA